MPIKDLTNQQFGKLTVIERDLSKKGGAAYWICKCECGTIKSIRGSNLTKTKNPTKSCGCLIKERKNENIDITSQIGKIYGKLIVIKRDLTKEIGHGKSSYWICKCECGNEVSVSLSNLTRGKTKSCGCLKRDMLIAKNTKDISNQRFGMVVAKERLSKLSPHHSFLWRCECDCGNNNYICSAENLLSGKIYSCGCNKNSYGEQIIEKILLENNIIFSKEFYFPDLKSKNNRYLKYDFAIFNKNNIIIRLIEFDGEQHYCINNKYYSKEGVLRDKIKNDYAKNHNIPLIRIPYSELNNLSIELIMGDKYLI